MSTSKKKSYKKRKQQAHTKAKTPQQPKQISKGEQFLNNWLWLITLVALIAAVVALVLLIPKCDDCAACNKTEPVAAEDIVPVDNFNKDMENFNISDYTDQFDMPKDGEEVAVLETSMGTIKMRLFENAAPKSVENFKTHIKDGYYNGVTFHRVISDFMIQGGDPTGTGSGGESIWGGTFEDEFNEYHNFRGALSMANTGRADTNSSQFFIVQAKDCGSTYEQMVDAGLPGWAALQYSKVGGYTMGDHEITHTTGYLGHTVFGQVFEGMDVVDAISAVAVDAENSKPLTDVVINSARLENYSSAPAEPTEPAA